MRTYHFWVQNSRFASTENFLERHEYTTFLSSISIYIQKIKVRYQSVNEILTIKENRNLTGQEHF